MCIKSRTMYGDIGELRGPSQPRTAAILLHARASLKPSSLRYRAYIIYTRKIIIAHGSRESVGFSPRYSCAAAERVVFHRNVEKRKIINRDNVRSGAPKTRGRPIGEQYFCFTTDNLHSVLNTLTHAHTHRHTIRYIA